MTFEEALTTTESEELIYGIDYKGKPTITRELPLGLDDSEFSDKFGPGCGDEGILPL